MNTTYPEPGRAAGDSSTGAAAGEPRFVRPGSGEHPAAVDGTPEPVDEQRQAPYRDGEATPEEEDGPGPPRSSTDDADEVDDREDPLDSDEVLRRLAGLFGGAGIDAGDMFVRGQNATGHGALAIGTVNVSAASESVEGRRVWSETLSEATVLDLVQGYAPAGSDQQLDHNLKQRHLVCLSGPAGSGRFTAAVVASARRHGIGGVNVVGVEQLTDLLRTELGQRRGCGYVLRLSDEDVGSLDGYTLMGLAARVSANGMTLLLVGDFSRRVQDLAGHIVEHRPAPAGEVFRARLRRELAGRCVGFCADGCTAECVEQYVDGECVRHPLLSAYLAGEPRPREVVSVVQAIAPSALRARSLTDRLTQLLPQQLSERAAQILDPPADVGAPMGWSVAQVRAFRLSCVVLAGLSTAEIRLAANRLVPGYEGAQPEPVRLRGTALDDLLGPTLRAAVMLPTERWATGNVQIQFAPGTEQLRSAVLDVAWTDWWPPRVLLGWLADLIRADLPEVRQAAAAAVGWSASRNVQAALDTVCDLARERRASVRQAAAIVLVAMAMQPRLRQRVRIELDRWAAGSAAHLRDTVARAHELGLARVWPEAALVQLRLVASGRMQRWHNSVVRGLVEIYQGGHQAVLLASLAEWTGLSDRTEHTDLTGAGEREVRLHAARALRILAERWARPPREHWPELLDLARHGVVSPDDLATLWATALSLPETAYRSWRTLGFWLSRADGQPEVAIHVLALLRLVLTGRPPLRRRLDHQLRHVWRPAMPGCLLLDDVENLIVEDA
ncbi:hypothetical protein [Micromonospora endophytica]|uniref:Uncharacterized protein n=1 Tax=Micromonospora endophytica TaxID=515350 RepID=A0A2W2C6U7_9ACTN|nr:hypothetical protein [Micromonospora endophytica]PZF95101.1 hypothetical protein C1I93_15750 [Micromonospora endophytica]RIW49920.1 hypothetical protein D3H59_03975 [Micromonospora endophytica]BCJ57129.1 hypothetical protein Jiend_05510 [Micromonospora endophytica]